LERDFAELGSRRKSNIQGLGLVLEQALQCRGNSRIGLGQASRAQSLDRAAAHPTVSFGAAALGSLLGFGQTRQRFDDFRFERGRHWRLLVAVPFQVPALVTIGSRIEYDVRFTQQKHEGFWTVNLGYAFGVGRSR